ncbi:hypothetical protein LSPH26S_02217 [Lysinibacillus sphaericus]
MPPALMVMRSDIARLGELPHRPVQLGLRDRGLERGDGEFDDLALARLDLGAEGVPHGDHRALDVHAVAGLALDGGDLVRREADGRLGRGGGGARQVPEGDGELLLVDREDRLGDPLLAEEGADDGDRVVVAAGGGADGLLAVEGQARLLGRHLDLLAADAELERRGGALAEGGLQLVDGLLLRAAADVHAEHRGAPWGRRSG